MQFAVRRHVSYGLTREDDQSIDGVIVDSVDIAIRRIDVRSHWNSILVFKPPMIRLGSVTEVGRVLTCRS
jgi:hypothetical protein